MNIPKYHGWVHTESGSWRADWVENLRSVPVPDDSRPVKQYPLGGEPNTGLRACEARGGTTVSNQASLIAKAIKADSRGGTHQFGGNSTSGQGLGRTEPPHGGGNRTSQAGWVARGLQAVPANPSVTVGKGRWS